MAMLLGASVLAVGASTVKYQRELSRKIRTTVSGWLWEDEELLVHSVRIDGHETHSGTTFFRVRVIGGPQAREWKVLRRYEEFLTLSRLLGATRRRTGAAFPGKTWLPCRDQKLAVRKGQLEKWLQGVLLEFATGGDARHAFVPRKRAAKLLALYQFLGLAPNGHVQGELQLPTVPLWQLPAEVPAVPAVPVREGEAQPFLEAQAVPSNRQEALDREEAELQQALELSRQEAEAAGRPPALACQALYYGAAQRA